MLFLFPLSKSFVCGQASGTGGCFSGKVPGDHVAGGSQLLQLPHHVSAAICSLRVVGLALDGADDVCRDEQALAQWLCWHRKHLLGLCTLAGFLGCLFRALFPFWQIPSSFTEV